MIIVEGAPNSVIATMGADALRMVGAAPTDQVCTLSSTGTFNVSAILAAIRKGVLPALRFVMPIDDAIRHHVGLRDINIPHARALPPDRLYEPVIFIMVPTPPRIEPTAELIDGAHRLWRLIDLGAPSFRALAVDLANIEPYRVTHEIRVAGKWQVLTDAELLKVTWGTYSNPKELTR